MQENTPYFNEYRKSPEDSEWSDVLEYAREILLTKGDLHEREEGNLIDYVWSDDLTGDSFRLIGTTFNEPAEFILEVNDGAKITDNRRKYAFNGTTQAIGVFDENSEHIRDEEAALLHLQLYIMDRLRTSHLPEPELNSEGKELFWQAAGRLAIQNSEIERMINRSLHFSLFSAKHKQCQVYENVETSEYYYSVPRTYIDQAVVSRTIELSRERSHRQICAPKETPEIEQ